MRIYKTTPKDKLYFKQRSLMGLNGCWEWKLKRNKGGYGVMRTGSYAAGTRGAALAHRKAYEVFKGSYDSSLKVLHKCDNPPCINPEHLFLGTQSDNNKDMRNKGRFYSKLSVEQVKDIRNKLINGTRPADLAREYGVKPCQIGAIKFRRQWRDI